MNRRKVFPTVGEWVQNLAAGDTTALGMAITLVESTSPTHQSLAAELLAACLPLAASKPTSMRVGITGVPGVGKSSFIEALGTQLVTRGNRVAVLAIDPSSPISKGSILGDKTRMARLASSANAFVRPSPTSGSLGGVARRTRESILLCETAGFDVVLVETVGVGQSETAVQAMTDFFLLLLLPNAGDELQGIKRGVVEMADMLVVNKCDGNMVGAARNTATAYNAALRLFPKKWHQWQPLTMTCSALSDESVLEIWNKILMYKKIAQTESYFSKKREEQAVFWLQDSVRDRLQALFLTHEGVKQLFQPLEEAVRRGALTPAAAAEQLITVFLKQ